MLAESIYKGVLDNGNFCTERGEFSTFKTRIPGGPAWYILKCKTVFFGRNINKNYT